MNKKKRVKKMVAIMSICIACSAVFLSVYSSVYAAYDYWDKLGYVDFRANMWNTKMPLSDITTFGANITTNSGVIYGAQSNPTFDDVRMEAKSRVTYGKKIEVETGQPVNIIAATQDTANTGGEPINSGNKFYWSIAEYNSTGIMMYDGEWQDSSNIWTIGQSVNNQDTFGFSGYPRGISQSIRKHNVKYIVPIFRWNNGDLHEGAGSNLNLKPDQISRTFPIFYLVSTPFTYHFDYNGGSAIIDNYEEYTYDIERLGTSTIDISRVTDNVKRDDYKFVGWKIKGGTGKQKDKVYTTEQLKTMMSDGKYWSSLFENAIFEAQWECNQYPQKLYVRYQNSDGSWGSYSNLYTEKYTGKTESFKWDIGYGGDFSIEESNIADSDYRWDSSLYKFPTKYDDGTALKYKVTKAENKYLSISRKAYISTFYPGKTSEDDEDNNWMDDANVYAGGSLDVPECEYQGRRYNISLSLDGGSLDSEGNTGASYNYDKQTTNIGMETYVTDDTYGDKLNNQEWKLNNNGLYEINGYLTFDSWLAHKKNYNGADWTEWYAEGDTIDNVLSDMKFVAYWNDETIIIPTPVREGYIFDGWYADEEFTQQVSENSITVSQGITEYEKTLYAKWTSQPFLKTSSQKGISTTNYEAGEHIEAGTVVTVKAEVKKGYKFKCWADADGNVVSTDVEYTFTMPDEDVSLLAYAKQKNADIIITKASSTMYNDTLIKRVEGDDKWYDEVGKYGIDILKEYSYDKCVQVWQINSDREIKRIK